MNHLSYKIVCVCYPQSVSSNTSIVTAYLRLLKWQYESYSFYTSQWAVDSAVGFSHYQKLAGGPSQRVLSLWLQFFSEQISYVVLMLDLIRIQQIQITAFRYVWKLVYFYISLQTMVTWWYNTSLTAILKMTLTEDNSLSFVHRTEQGCLKTLTILQMLTWSQIIEVHPLCHVCCWHCHGYIYFHVKRRSTHKQKSKICNKLTLFFKC